MDEHKPMEITPVDLHGFSHHFETREAKRKRPNPKQNHQEQDVREITLLDSFDRAFQDHGINDYGCPTFDNSNATRAYNCLRRGGYSTLGLLAEASPSDFFKIRGFGQKSLDVVGDVLSTYGLNLAGAREKNPEQAEQEGAQNPLEIELSALLNSGSNDDKKLLNVLKRRGATTLGGLQSLLGESRYVSPKGRVAYPIRGIGENYFKRLEEVTSSLGVDIYATSEIDPMLKPYMEIAKRHVPFESYYSFRREVEEAYATEKPGAKEK